MSQPASDDLDILELIDDCRSLLPASPQMLRIPEPRPSRTVVIGDDSVALLAGYSDYGG
ncbi:MAG: hypothetical protein M3Z02_08375 [Actinomycetota bacterium]|nr:hypothetical protein [Actinomycetota bacterium]